MADDDANAIALVDAPPRLLHSDPHDFAGLYVRHRGSFTAHARRYLRDQRDADEVVQEAFLRLFLALPELETELQALAYCRRTITNLCIDRYRAQARRPYLIDLDSAHVEDLADDDPGDPVVRAEDAALVRTALSLLSPLQQAALVKREVEDKPLPVIAGELEIPEDNVKHLLFRARRALRKLLAGTSLAPGADAEAHGLPLTARAGSRGLAALLVMVVLGLGSGPNLESVPVVGVDLPDVIGATEAAQTVRGVVTRVGDKIAPSGGAGTTPVGAGRDAAPLPLAQPSTPRSAEAAGRPGGAPSVGRESVTDVLSLSPAPATAAVAAAASAAAAPAAGTPAAAASAAAPPAASTPADPPQQAPASSTTAPSSSTSPALGGTAGHGGHGRPAARPAPGAAPPKPDVVQPEPVQPAPAPDRVVPEPAQAWPKPGNGKPDHGQTVNGKVPPGQTGNGKVPPGQTGNGKVPPGQAKPKPNKPAHLLARLGATTAAAQPTTDAAAPAAPAPAGSAPTTP